MSRITGSDALKMVEAYAAVYPSVEQIKLTEEQVWEEVETWVNSLLEEGYDLSEYTWEEMYEFYLSEAPALNYGNPDVARYNQAVAQSNKDRATRSTAQRQVQTALGQGRGINVRGATSGAAQGRGFGAVSGGRQGIVVNTPLKPGETQQINVAGRTLFPAKSGNRTVYLPSKDSKPATPLFKSSTKKPDLGTDAGDKGDNGGGGNGGGGGNLPPQPKGDVIVKAAKGGVPGSLNKTTGKWTASDGGKVAPAPSTPTPAKPATGTLGNTSFERRTPTSSELKAAQSARASGASPEKALQAAKSAGGSAKIQSAGNAAGAAAFKSKTIDAASSSSPSASGSVVPASNKIAASPKPTPLTPRQQRLNMEMEYDAYDLVLEYLLSQGHVDTVEEAHYVMMEMDAETIGSIVEETK